MHDAIPYRPDDRRLGQSDRAVGWRDYVPAIGLLVVGLGGLTVGNLLATPVPGHYLVMTPPGMTRFEILDLVFRAHGGLVGIGGLPNIATAVSDDPAFPAALRAEGAWLVLPSPRLIGCFSPSGEGR